MANGEPELIAARDAPLVEFARRVLAKRWKAAAKRAAQVDPAQSVTLHPLRIELKKLRYGSEFFASLFAKKSTKKFVELLSEIQDQLGRINDATAALRLSDTLRQECAEVDVREALGALRGVCATRLSCEIKPILKAWKGLKQADLYWL